MFDTFAIKDDVFATCPVMYIRCRFDEVPTQFWINGMYNRHEEKPEKEGQSDGISNLVLNFA